MFCIVLRTLVLFLLVSLISPSFAQENLPERIDGLFSNPSVTSSPIPEKKATALSKSGRKQNEEKFSEILSGYLASTQSNATGRSYKSSANGSSFVRLNYSGDVQVYVELSTLNQDILDQLKSLGLEIEVSNKSLNKVQGWIDPDRLADIAAETFVKRISTPSYSYSKKGAALSQGRNQVRSNVLARMGHTGEGVKVGIVSSGANDWRSASATGDLPNKVTVYGSCTKRSSDGSTGDLCSLFDSSCNEGTAMAEIVHDLAPDAELAIAAVGTSLEFISQIQRLITEFKADIIVDDLGFNFESSFYDDDIALAIAAMPDDVLFVSSAGNGGYGNYRADLSRSSIFFPDFDAVAETPHNFSNRNGIDDPFHGFVIPANSATTVILKWDGRPQSFGLQHTLRLWVYDQTGQLIFLSPEQIRRSDEAITGICIPNQSNDNVVYFVAVSASDGPLGPRPFQLQFFGGGAIEYPFSPSSIFGHPAVERVLAVGAINADRISENTVNFYSSRGPSLIYEVFTEEAGLDRLVLKQRRRKPDLVSIDGVRVTGTGGFPNRFFGTSAAAPHVAGIAAQLMSVSRLATAEDVRAALIAGAIDMESPGFDNLSGYGLADAVAAFEALKLSSPILSVLFMLLDDEEESN